MKLLTKRNIIGVVLGLLIIVGSFIFFSSDNINMFYFFSIIALVVAVLPFVFTVIMETSKEKEIDKYFLEFVRDLVENVKSGTPISKSISNLGQRNYGPLTLYLEKLINQISIGIPLSNAFTTFAKDTKSGMISRAVNLISQAERAGGEIETILESVSTSVNQTEVLRQEQKSAVYNLVVQGYIIFMIFIVIMLVLQFKILPLATGIGDVEGLSLRTASLDVSKFTTPILMMLLVQSFFTGLVIGKISEGTYKNGIKHSFILVALALLISSAANAFLVG